MGLEGWQGGDTVTVNIPDEVKDTLEGNPENERFHSVSPYRV